MWGLTLGTALVTGVASGMGQATAAMFLERGWRVIGIEDGFDGLFVQHQVGHEHASTTSIYTSVSSDYRTRVLRSALDEVISRATTNDETRGQR